MNVDARNVLFVNIAYMGVYVGISIVWIGHMMYYGQVLRKWFKSWENRTFSSIRLHYVVMMIFLSKIMGLGGVAGYNVYCWLREDEMESCSKSLISKVASIFNIPFLAWGSVGLFLIARGYGITKSRLSLVEKKYLIWYSTSLIISLIAELFSPLYFQLPLLIVFLVLAGFVSTSLISTKRRLEIQKRLYSHLNIPIHTTPPAKKLNVMRYFQLFLIFYFSAKILLRVLLGIIVQKYDLYPKYLFAITLADEGIELFSLVIMAFILRLRNWKSMQPFNSDSDHYGLLNASFHSSRPEPEEESQNPSSQTNVPQVSKFPNVSEDHCIVFRYSETNENESYFLAYDP